MLGALLICYGFFARRLLFFCGGGGCCYVAAESKRNGELAESSMRSISAFPIFVFLLILCSFFAYPDQARASVASAEQPDGTNFGGKQWQRW